MATADDIRNASGVFLTEDDNESIAMETEDLNTNSSVGVPLLFENMADMEKRLGPKLKSVEYNQDIDKAIQTIVEKLQSCIEPKAQASPYKYIGTFIPISTHTDSKGSLMYDYLYIIKQPDIELWPRKRSGTDFKVTLNDEDLEPLQLNDAFRSSLDEIFQEDMGLPESLQYAGFAGPEYSGVRRNGSSSSVLFNWKNDQLVVLNLTLALPLPPDDEKPFLDDILKKIGPMRDENQQTAFDLVHKIHLVPKPPHEKVWILCTSLLEVKLLKQIYASAPINKIMKYIDLFLEHFENKAHRAVKFTKPEESINTIAIDLGMLVDIYMQDRSKDLRNDIIKIMRYAHVFLTPEQVSNLNEIPKVATSMSPYALRNLILRKAAETSGCFTPTAGTRVVDKLLVAVMEELSQAQEGNQTVQHYFIDLKIPLWSASTAGDAYKCRYVDIATRQCQKMLQRIQQTREQKEQTDFAQKYDIIEPNPSPEKLTLHPYQEEIVGKVRNTTNCVVFMPRNTGKSHIAVHLADETAQKHQKTVHLNTTHSGLWDRWTMYKRYLPDCRSVMVHSEKNRCTDLVSFETIIEEHDVILTTPDFLTEQLNHGTISFEMLHCILFDDCEGCSKISRLFKLYLGQKQSGKLPKVIGFTSHLGNVKSKSVDKTIKHIMKICACLDTSSIIQVDDLSNRCQMMKGAYATKQENIQLPSWHTQSEFEKRVRLLEVQMFTDLLNNQTLPPELKLHLNTAIAGRAKGERHQWCSRAKDIADKHFNISSNLRLQLEMTLNKYKMNTSALWLNNGISGQYAQDFVRYELGKKDRQEKNIYEQQLDRLYTQSILEPGRWCAYTSPRLDRLRQVLTDWRHTRRHMRTIVCCQSLSMTQFLFKWMTSEFFGLRMDIHQGCNQATTDQIHEMFDNFKKGEIHVLFMTTIASSTYDLKPDLEVVYNHPDGVMEIHKVVAPGEVVQVTRREQLRDNALREIRGMSPADYKSQLLEEQHKLLRE